MKASVAGITPSNMIHLFFYRFTVLCTDPDKDAGQEALNPVPTLALVKLVLVSLGAHIDHSEMTEEGQTWFAQYSTEVCAHAPTLSDTGNCYHQGILLYHGLGGGRPGENQRQSCEVAAHFDCAH